MWTSIAVAAALASVTSRPHGMRVGSGAAHATVSRPSVARTCVTMETPSKEKDEALYEDYIKKRIESGEDVESAYDDLGLDLDFDGGDSGSGAVGDGKVTLDDQHNSPFIVGSGSATDAVQSFSNAGSMVDDPATSKKSGPVQGAVNARDVKQKNYWGRQVGTGYADELEKKGKYVDRPVLRQQLENWQNQQNLKSATDAAVDAQTTFFGQTQADQSTAYRKLKGRPIDSLRSQIQVEADTANERLDGEEWGELTVPEGVEFTEEFELYATPNSPAVLDIEVENQIAAFSPYQCGFTADSPPSMKLTPTGGVMEKRGTGHPVELTVRFTPKEYGIPVIGYVVFETEDFKNVYKIVGKTAK